MELILAVIILAFLFETMDSSAGMGFGTGLTPLLLLIGYSPLQVTPILLLSETITGFTSGFFHQEFQNVNFRFNPPVTKDTKVMLVIALTGCGAIIISVVLTYYALKFPASLIRTYVAVLVLFMGFFGLLRLTKKHERFHPRLLTGFSALAGFNKGIGAGGYGPVVMLGQLLSGIYEKTATAIVSLAEGIVSLIGFGTFLFISAYGIQIDYVLLPSVFTGGFVAAIFSPFMVRVLPNKIWRVVIPIYALSIGIYSLLNIYLT